MKIIKYDEDLIIWHRSLNIIIKKSINLHLEGVVKIIFIIKLIVKIIAET